MLDRRGGTDFVINGRRDVVEHRRGRQIDRLDGMRIDRVWFFDRRFGQGRHGVSCAGMGSMPSFAEAKSIGSAGKSIGIAEASTVARCSGSSSETVTVGSPAGGSLVSIG